MEKVHIYCDKDFLEIVQHVVLTLKFGFEMLNTNVSVKTDHFDWNSINRYDILIWVGVKNMKLVPWAKLKSRDVYLIYYQTEPIFLLNPFDESDNLILNPQILHNGLEVGIHPYTLLNLYEPVHEIWDFSLQNIDEITKFWQNKKIKPNLRYVPLACLIQPFVKQNNSNNLKLVFFGQSKYRPSWNKLKTQIGEKKLISTFNIWDDVSFQFIP